MWRWKKNSCIPRLAVYGPKIATIFDCDEQSFRNDPYPVFRAKCEAKIDNWASVLSRATLDLAAVRPSSYGARQADLEGELDDDLPTVAPGQAFTIKFPSDPDAVESARWVDWHVLIFNGDSGGYLNWLPRHDTTQEFRGLDRFPRASRCLTAPRAGFRPLTPGKRASGEHDIVFIVSRDRIPEELEGKFRADPRNAELQPYLDQLAVWLVPRLQRGEAAAMRGLYFVGTSLGEPDTGDRAS